MSDEKNLFLRRLMARLLFVPTLVWNIMWGRVLRVRHWWDKIDDHVYMGAFPFTLDVAAMKRTGIGAVVNTCEEYRGPVKAYERAGIVQLWIPTVDFTAPNLRDVERGVAFMQEQIGLGRDVYVHCKAGRARSGTIVLCWLIAARGLTPEEAQRQILARRPHAHSRLYRRAVVQQFWQNRQAATDSIPSPRQ